MSEETKADVDWLAQRLFGFAFAQTELQALAELVSHKNKDAWSYHQKLRFIELYRKVATATTSEAEATEWREWVGNDETERWKKLLSYATPRTRVVG